MLSGNQSKVSKECGDSTPTITSAVRTAAETESAAAKSDPTRKIVIIERNSFLRDCLRHGVASYWPGAVVGCASVGDLEQFHNFSSSIVIVLSVISLTAEEANAEFALLTDQNSPFRSMILAKYDDLNEVLAALGRGANGYISMSAGFEIFVQAVQFVAAGGTYVPPQCLVAAKSTSAAASDQTLEGGVTSREMAVIQAIRQGKPNKVIAYELNMCESTVKVHVRHVMKKLHARNRTDVAIKAGELSKPSSRVGCVAPRFALDG
jgi:DNA-binding NarL/FixJ family response regulator